MVIENIKYEETNFSEDDFYVFAIGYEQRSYYLLDKLLSKYSDIKPLVFVLNDYEKYPHTNRKVEELKKTNCELVFESYENSQGVHDKIIKCIKDLVLKNESLNVHIDYSSMPRSWYCKLPLILKNITREQDKISFWYSEGEYPSSYEEFPSAGINSFTFFSGKPSLQIDNNRIHILALGYDVIRSQAIISITDPDYLVACYAYNPNRDGFSESLRKVNTQIFNRSAMILALHLDDFAFIVSKLCETANELLPIGDIILIPDGPKPLIFAFSLVPDLVKKDGITCLHVSRNKEHFKAVNVTATGVVYGFAIRNKH